MTVICDLNINVAHLKSVRVFLQIYSSNKLSTCRYLSAEFTRGPHREVRRASGCHRGPAERRDTGICVMTGLVVGRPINWCSFPLSHRAELFRARQLFLSAGAKRAGREADGLPPSIAEIKNERSCTFTPPFIFIVCSELNTALHFILETFKNFLGSNSEVICSNLGRDPRCPHRGCFIVFLSVSRQMSAECDFYIVTTSFFQILFKRHIYYSPLIGQCIDWPLKALNMFFLFFLQI
jgi:hypothetical protein